MNTNKYFAKLLFLVIMLTGLMIFPHIMIAEEEEEVIQLDIAEIETGPSIGNFWDLTKHAGGFRWLIFLVLIAGVFLISMKIYELVLDSKKAHQFEKTDLRNLEKNQIVSLISLESEHMLSRLTATLINVFQTSRSAESLHEEIANYVQFQHDRFATFRTRIDFLADTAGALGLLGTVWGMFIVFFSGNLDKQVILTGMGIALLTTLLGLVVSIFLNFFSTVASGIYNKRLDQVIQKSDELRFRLLEFNNGASVKEDIMPQINKYPKEPVDTKVLADKQFDGKWESTGIETLEKDIKSVAVQEKKEIEEKSYPERFELESELGEYKVGEIIKNVSLKVIGKKSKPIPDADVALRLLTGDGIINNNGSLEKLKSDAKGIVRFNWSLGKKVGEQIIEATTISENGKPVKFQIPVSVKPGKPHTIKTKGNNQVGVAGKQLPKPLIIEVSDEFGNAIAECDVRFQVSMGNGSFPNGKSSATIQTDKNGIAKMLFSLDKEPGFNAVTSTVKEGNQQVKFQAMGQEENN